MRNIIKLIVVCLVITLQTNIISAQSDNGTMHLFNAAMECYNRQDFENAYKYAEQAAVKGDAHSQYLLSVLLNFGYGTEENKLLALDWLIKAAEQDFLAAQNNLVDWYYLGMDEVKRNGRKSMYWLKRAADNGDEKRIQELKSIKYINNSVDETNDKTFAIVFSNGSCVYDTFLFSDYCNMCLGIPINNIHVISKASLNDIFAELDWLSNVMKAYEGDAKAIIYYSGLGMSDESTGESYLLPSDGNIKDVYSGFSLGEMYDILNTLQTRGITVILDCAFSGTDRDGNVLSSARGVAIKSKPAQPLNSICTIHSSSGNESAYNTDEGLGLFTTVFLTKIKDTKGNISLGELVDYSIQQVKKNAITQKGKPQTPQVIVSSQLGDSWRKWRLNE